MATLPFSVHINYAQFHAFLSLIYFFHVMFFLLPYTNNLLWRLKNLLKFIENLNEFQFIFFKRREHSL